MSGIEIHLDRISVRAKARKLRATWSVMDGDEVRPPIEPTEDYFSSQGKPYQKFTATSSISLPVLQFLWGQPWDEIAKNFLPALRPSMVRVGSIETLDAMAWRVSVHVDKQNIIQQISQEVEVSCNGAAHGHDLQMILAERGILLR